MDLISQIHWSYISDHTNQKLVAYLVVVQARRDAGLLSYDAQILKDLYKVNVEDQSLFTRNLTDLGLQCQRDPGFEGTDLCLRQYTDDGQEISPQRKPKARLEKFEAKSPNLEERQQITQNYEIQKSSESSFEQRPPHHSQSQYQDLNKDRHFESIGKLYQSNTNEKPKYNTNNENRIEKNGDIRVRRTYRISQEMVETNHGNNNHENKKEDEQKSASALLKMAKSEPLFQPLLKQQLAQSNLLTNTNNKQEINSKVLDIPMFSRPENLRTENSDIVERDDSKPDSQTQDPENINFLGGLDNQSNYFRAKGFYSSKASPRDLNSSTTGNQRNISLKHNSSYNQLFNNHEPQTNKKSIKKSPSDAAFLENYTNKEQEKPRQIQINNLSGSINFTQRIKKKPKIMGHDSYRRYERSSKVDPKRIAAPLLDFEFGKKGSTELALVGSHLFTQSSKQTPRNFNFTETAPEPIKLTDRDPIKPKIALSGSPGNTKGPINLTESRRAIQVEGSYPRTVNVNRSAYTSQPTSVNIKRREKSVHNPEYSNGYYTSNAQFSKPGQNRSSSILQNTSGNIQTSRKNSSSIVNTSLSHLKDVKQNKKDRTEQHQQGAKRVYSKSRNPSSHNEYQLNNFTEIMGSSYQLKSAFIQPQNVGSSTRLQTLPYYPSSNTIQDSFSSQQQPRYQPHTNYSNATSRYRKIEKSSQGRPEGVEFNRAFVAREASRTGGDDSFSRRTYSRKLKDRVGQVPAQNQPYIHSYLKRQREKEGPNFKRSLLKLKNSHRGMYNII